MTRLDRASGPSYYVVGVRANGDRCVLCEANDKGEAIRTAATLRTYLEGYASIEVEQVRAVILSWH